MDRAVGEAAIKNFNGGVIFLSYVISVIGAQTTLELLTRRTHIRGTYNWFLLIAASFVMGAVSIWSMHFIGNNSLQLCIGQESHQLVYNAGYTFASLVVAVACMFIAFIFVGTTEDAMLSRIVPSGIFAGLGITCMHYMGQFAVEYFILVYRIDYLIGAIILACVAVTIALYIFFKLRERWMNQWYKRLGCALLMALAVCGMHYTGLVGTDFYKPAGNNEAPVPRLQEPTVIGITSAVIVCCCVGLLYISIKAGIQILPKYISKKKKSSHRKRLFLDAVLFDPSGRILVKVDGTLPMSEIVHHLEWIYHPMTNNNGSDADNNRDRLHLKKQQKEQQEFNASHPLFARLLQTSIEKASSANSNRLLSVKRPSGSSSSTASSTTEIYDTIEKDFLEGWQNLKNELRFRSIAELGILSDIIITTDTIVSPPSSSFLPFQQNPKGAGRNNRFSSATTWSKVEVIGNHLKATNAYIDTSEDDGNAFYDDDRHIDEDDTDDAHYRHQPHDEENVNQHLKKQIKKKDRFMKRFNIKQHPNESTSTSTETTAASRRNYIEDEDTVINSSHYATFGSGITHTDGGRNTQNVYSHSSTNASVDNVSYQKEEGRYSIDDLEGEDKHIFLVRKLTNDEDAQHLLSQGFRFADPVFISKTMAVKLRIPTETMRHYFTDMRQMADSLQSLTQPRKMSFKTAAGSSASEEDVPLDPTIFRATTQSTVQMGAFVLLDESQDLTDVQIVVEKSRRYTFPQTQLMLDDDSSLSTLNSEEVKFLNRLKGRSLFDFANLDQTLLRVKEEEEREAALDAGDTVNNHYMKDHVEDLADEKSSYSQYSSYDDNKKFSNTSTTAAEAASHPTVRPAFIRALETAAKSLINSTSYNKALFQTSKLSMHSSSSSTVLDLPAFAITTGPCQLICFTSFITTPGAAAAVNYTFTEAIKSIPLSLYRPLCGYITDQAASIYQKSKLLYPSSNGPTSYLLLQQQQVYSQQTGMVSSEAIPLDTLGNENDIHSSATTDIAGSPTDKAQPSAIADTKNENERQQRTLPPLDDMHLEPTPAFSLPPPPRLKKNNRFKLANALLNANSGTITGNYHVDSNTNLTATTATAAAYVLHHQHSRNFLDDTPLTVLTTQDRFWWINPLVENTIHNGQ